MSDDCLHATLVDLGPGWGDRPALASSQCRLTYRDLSRRVAVVASWLRAKGCGPGERVGMCLPKSPESVISILAILATGAAYIPIDAGAPMARIRQIIQLGDPRLVIANEATAGKVGDGGGDRDGPEIFVVASFGRGEGLDALDAGVDAEPPFDVATDDVAAILFTSGSTGVPKGVTLSHRNILSFVDWAIGAFEIGPEDRLTSHAPFHFDLSTFDLFATLRTGASLYLFDETEVMFPPRVTDILAREGTTIWYSVPTALRQLLDLGALERRDLSRLRAILFAGEIFRAKDLSRLMRTLDRPQYFNLYGPTETNVCTYYRVPGPPSGDDRDLPIGRPCENVTVVIAGDDGKQVPNGEPGEICVTGPAVMRGYWGEPALTEKVRLDGRADSYRTGDFGVADETGSIRFLGRRDRQVKVRGFRIELDEIEKALLDHADVEEAAVFVVDGTEDSKTVVAVVAGLNGAPELSTAAGQHCGDLLPSYARPDDIVAMAKLPRLSTGKIDRRAIHDDFLRRADGRQ